MEKKHYGGDSRRDFLRQALSAVAGVTVAPGLWAHPVEPLHPSGVDRPIPPQPFACRLGYAAITWAGHDEQAIDEIAALGFHGIQLRAGVLERWGDRPRELRQRLRDKGLELFCFSSGSVDATPERRREHVEAHVAHARFTKELGGDLLQIISERPKGRAPTPDEFERLGRLLTEIGQRTLDLGVRVVYHNHMDGFGEAPEDVARVLDLTDRRFVWLLLDIAHYQQGGGDPAAAVRRHSDRLAILHLKDVTGPLPGDTRPTRESYRFVELGRGRVDVPGVIAALKEVRFRGPAVIELDAVTEPGRSPRECGVINRQYATEKLGLSL